MVEENLSVMEYLVSQTSFKAQGKKQGPETRKADPSCGVFEFVLFLSIPWRYKQRKKDVLPEVSAPYSIAIYNIIYYLPTVYLRSDEDSLLTME